MSRRLLLGLCLLAACAALTGCSAPGSLTLSPVTDTELAENATRDLPTGDERENEFARVVRTAVENGSATATGVSPPIDPDGLPVVVDGRVYDLAAEPITDRTETRVSVEIDYNATDTAGEAVAYDELSSADRALLEPLLPPRTDRRVPGPDLGAGARYTDAERAASALAGEERHDVVVYDGRRYPIVVETRPVTITVYRYTAEEIAANLTDYGRTLREEKAFTLRGLSDAERTVVEEARSGGYYADSSDDTAFERIRSRFRSRPAVIADEYHGRWVVRYDGVVYWATLHDGGFD